MYHSIGKTVSLILYKSYSMVHTRVLVSHFEAVTATSGPFNDTYDEQEESNAAQHFQCLLILTLTQVFL